MGELPSGTVTFLFTDIEGSTRLLQELGDHYSDLLSAHQTLLRRVFHDHKGREIDTQGDAFFVAFDRAFDAVGAAAGIQRAVWSYAWPDGKAVRVRIGAHTGEPTVGGGGYLGIDVHRAARICQAGHGGQVLLSDSTRALVERELAVGLSLRDLGLHRLKDLAYPERLFQLVIAGLPSEFPPLKSLDALPNNLPVQLTSFVGREREMADVKTLLSRTRLLTLTGVGGSGKTRLALQAGADVLEAFPDGVWLVELGGLVDPASLPRTVASALGLREEPGRAVADTLADYLHTRTALLILDNCEHLVAACGALADRLLRRCVHIKVLATSREGLGIAGEHLYVVPSLPFPGADEAQDPETLHAYPAVRLFVDRARAHTPSFRLDVRTGAAIGEICRRLDGMPLAIELAAPRVRVLSPQQIAERLHDRFQLLTGGSRTALPRQQTLQAAIDWSHELLSDAEKLLFRRLGVFVSGWTLEAAEAVCSAEPLRQADILPVLTHLVERSLVVAEEQDGEARYRLLETIRQYARDRLVESGEAEAQRRAHRDYFRGLLERIEDELFGPRSGLWFDRLERDHDNLRAALEWSLLAEPDGEAVLNIVSLLRWFWDARGYWHEGRAWVDAGLKANKGVPTAGRARALYVGGRLAHRQGDPAAGSMLEEGLALARQLDLKLVIVQSNWWLGNVAWNRGEYGSAIASYEESVVLSREVFPRLTGLLLIGLSDLYWVVGDYARSREVLEDGISLARNQIEPAYRAMGLSAASHLARMRGHYAEAKQYSEEAIADFKQLTRGLKVNPPAIGWRLTDLGTVARETGDYAKATAHLEEAEMIYREVGSRSMLADTLLEHALGEWDQGHLDRAEELFEQSLSLYKEVGNEAASASCLRELGELARCRRDHETAGRLIENSLATFRLLGHQPGTGRTLLSLAAVSREAGQYEQAASLLNEALVLWAGGMTRLEKVHWLEAYAAVAPHVGKAERGARFLAAAARAREEMGTPLPPVERESYEQVLIDLRAALGEERLEAVRREGKAVTVEQAIESLLAKAP